jgi:hypothetical protein
MNPAMNKARWVMNLVIATWDQLILDKKFLTEFPPMMLNPSVPLSLSRIIESFCSSCCKYKTKTKVSFK